MGQDKSRVAAEVPTDLKQQIRLEAARRGVSMAELIRETLQDEFGDGGSGNGDVDGEGQNHGPKALRKKETAGGC